MSLNKDQDYGGVVDYTLIPAVMAGMESIILDRIASGALKTIFDR